MNQFKGKDLIKRWRRNNVACSLYDLGYDFSAGKYRLGYSFIWKGRVIFEGQDFFASPLYDPDNIKTLYDLLSFLTLRPGDTDKEYFQNCTPAQMDWCNSLECEDLQCWVSDRE